MLWASLLVLTASSKWLCAQVDAQYHIIHDKLEKIEHPMVNELKKIIGDYWEENSHHCSNSF